MPQIWGKYPGRSCREGRRTILIRRFLHFVRRFCAARPYPDAELAPQGVLTRMLWRRGVWPVLNALEHKRYLLIGRQVLQSQALVDLAKVSDCSGGQLVPATPSDVAQPNDI